MSGRRGALSVLVVVLSVVLVQAVAPPPRLSPAQNEKLAQRNLWLQRAKTHVRAGEIDEAIAAIQKGLALVRAVFGTLRVASLPWLAVQASLQEQREKFTEAEVARRELLRRKEELYGRGDWRVTDARLDLEHTRRLARLDVKQRHQLRQAEQWNLRVVRLWQQGKSKEALPLAQKALAVRREVLGEKHRHTAQSWLNLSAQHKELAQWAEAEGCSRRALDIRKATLGEKHPHYAQSLNNLATLYQNRGDYQAALPLYKQALDLRKATQGEMHPDYAMSLGGLALLHRDMGDYKAALPLLKQARDIRKALGEKHPEYATSLNNLALLYQDMGDYKAALPLFKEALDIRKATLGEKHPLSALSLSNLASLSQEMGDSKAALPLYKQALEIYKATGEEKQPKYAASLNNLALLYHDMGDDKAALPLFKQALDIRKATLGEKHSKYAASLSNLAGLYQAMGDYKAALPLYKQALEIYKDTGEKHPKSATSLSNLAALYRAMEDYKAALPLYNQAVDIRQRHLDATFSALSDRQRLDLLARSRWQLNVYLSLPQPASATAEYKRVLAWKAAVVARQAEDRLLRDLPKLANRLTELRTVRAGLAKLSAQTPTPVGQKQWLERFRELEAQKEKLEVSLSTDSAEFRILRQVDPDAIAAALPDGFALVDLLVYQHSRPDPNRKGKWLFEERLVAFVLVKGGKVQRLELKALAPIEKAVLAWRQPFQSRPVGAIDQDAAAKLRKQLWQPIQKALGKTRTVLIAPDGILCALPFAALPGDKPGSFLVEDFTIGYLTSGRHLLELTNLSGTVSGEGLLAVGGLDYGKASARKNGRERLDLGVGACRELPGTRLEIDRIGGLFRARFPKGRAVEKLTGDAADKNALKRHLTPGKDMKAWRYLHLATHAFFLPAPPVPRHLTGEELSFAQERDNLTAERNPLLRTGLVLSGANRSHETGLCRSEEVADLDLRGTQVVVLSACDTALGKLQQGEGMLGLQRAFQLTGARSLVASQWKVRDSATSVLMEELYRQLWVAKRTPLQALRQAQLAVLRDPGSVEKREKELVRSGSRDPEDEAAPLPRPTQKRSHPALWAAFVLSGDCR